MAERVLSIEMGYSLTKVCEMELGSKTPKIFNSFMVVTPEGMLKDGIVDSDDEFINTFLRMMTVKRIKTRKAIFTISSSKIATREARIPYCKESKIKDVVRANLGDYFPIDGSQFMFSHSIIGLEFEQDNTVDDAKQIEQRDSMTKAEQVKAELEAGGKGGKKKGKPIGYKVLLLAAPKQLVQSYERLANNIGLQIQSLDYNGNSIYQAAREECRDGVQLIVKVDEKATLLMVTEDGATTLNRTIPYGVDEAIKHLMGTYGFGEVNTYEKALEAARRRNVLMPSFDECDPESTNSEVKDKSSITLTLRSLAGGIIRVIDYYNANHSQKPIEKMLITGLGADFQGLDVLLTSEIGLKIRDITHVSGVDISRLFRGAAYSEYVGCIGACIAPINFYPESADDESSGRGGDVSVSASTVAFIFLGAGIVAAIVMVVMTMIPYLQETSKNEEYNARITELQPVYDQYLTYLKLTDDVKYVETLDAASKNRNADFVGFLGDLESCLPQDSMIEWISINEGGIQMDVQVLTKEEVAATIYNLKQLPYFIDTECTGVSQYVAEAGNNAYEFSVTMTYAPLFDENADDAEAEETAEEVE